MAILFSNTPNISLYVKYLDPDKIKLGDVVGGVNPDGSYRGVHCLLAAQTEVKVQPRILIAPGFTHERPLIEGNKMANPMVSELLGVAERLRAVVLSDCPDGNAQEAIDYREDFGSARLYSIYPWVKIYDSSTDTINNFPSSAIAAGLLAKSDNERGFWWSPSNTLINGIVGISKPIDFALGDTNCKANYLNENNVATIIQEDGFRLWGNRTASADPKWAFLSVRRTADIPFADYDNRVNDEDIIHSIKKSIYNDYND